MSSKRTDRPAKMARDATPTQRAVLGAALPTGYTVEFGTHNGATGTAKTVFCWDAYVGGHRINRGTHTALVRRGWVAHVSGQHGSHRFVVTPAGRAAI